MKFWTCERCGEAFNTEEERRCWACGKPRDKEETYDVYLGR